MIISFPLLRYHLNIQCLRQYSEQIRFHLWCIRD